MEIPPKQELFERIMPVGPNKSSPTALSLLLRSSVFKELVEKNSNDEAPPQGKVIRNKYELHEHEFGGIVSYRGIENSPYEIPLSGLEAKQETALPLLTTTGKTMWNSMPH